MEWPSQSPGLNPLENLWHYIKVRLRKRPKAKSRAELMEHVNELWRGISQRLLDTLIESMSHRVKAAIKAEGGHQVLTPRGDNGRYKRGKKQFSVFLSIFRHQYLETEKRNQVH